MTGGYIFRITLFTLEQSLGSVVIAAVMGLLASYFVSRKKFFGSAILKSFSAIPLCMPPLIMALGFIQTFGISGCFNRLLISLFNLKNPPLKFLYSFAGIIITQGFYNFPLIMLTCCDGWKKLDAEKSEAARLLGAGNVKIFFTVELPELLPSLISGCIPAFLYCFFSFIIVLMFGAPGSTTLEVAVYHAGRTGNDFSTALKLSLIETVIAFAVLTAYALIEKKSLNANKSQTSARKLVQHKITKKEIVPFLIFSLLIIIFFITPLFSIVLNSVLNIKKTGKIFYSKGFYLALKNTVFTGFLTSVCATVLGLLYSLLLRYKDPNAKNIFFRIIAILPMTISSVITGIIFIKIVHRGTFWTLVAAETLLYWPFCYRQIYSKMVRTPQEVLEAARILSKNKMDSIFKVIIPQSKDAVLSSLAFCFALSAGDSTLPLVLAIRDFDTLSLYTYRLAGSYRIKEACMAGLVLSILCMGFFIVSEKIKNRKNYNA